MAQVEKMIWGKLFCRELVGGEQPYSDSVVGSRTCWKITGIQQTLVEYLGKKEISFSNQSLLRNSSYRGGGQGSSQNWGAQLGSPHAAPLGWQGGKGLERKAVS